MSRAEPLDYKPDELRTVVRTWIADRDINAVIVQRMIAQGGIAEIGEEIGNACAPDGEADRVIAQLRTPATARAYVRRLLHRFAPFAEIIADVLPRGTWRLTNKAGRREFAPYPPPNVKP